MCLNINTLWEFNQISEWLNSKPISDYFDFPFSAYSFSKSRPTSHPKISHNSLWRVYGSTATLITFFDPDQLLSSKNELRGTGIKNFKSLNFVNKNLSNIPTVKYRPEFSVDRVWDINKSIDSITTGKHRRNRRRDLKRGERLFKINEAVKIDDCQTIFEKWSSAASNRHFMVIKGHYQRYISDFFRLKPSNVFMKIFAADTPIGLCGYEVFKDFAQITVMKNIPNDQSFPFWFWAKTISTIFNENPGVNKIFCGTTAESLKIDLGLKQEPSYKLRLEL